MRRRIVSAVLVATGIVLAIIWLAAVLVLALAIGASGQYHQ